MRKRCLPILMALLMTLPVCLFAASTKKDAAVSKFESTRTQWPKIDVSSSKLTGEISGVSARFVAIVYGRNEREKVSLEAAFNINKSVAITGRKSMDQFKIGDTIEVAFNEETRTYEDGKKSIKRVTKAVTLIKEAAKAVKAVEVQESIPASTQGEGLKIKDFKER